MKFMVSLIFFCFSLVFCSNHKTDPVPTQITTPIVIPIAIHYLYDSTRYDLSYLKEEIVSIKQVIDATNRRFKGKIFFKLMVSDKQAYTGSLMDMYISYDNGDDSKVQYVTKKFYTNNCLNIYVLRTESFNGQQIIGFTPPNPWSMISKDYDNIFISYTGLFEFSSGATLAHEIGHWLGLKHTFQMSYYELQSFGLTDPNESCINIMNYNCYVERFTNEQIIYMMEYAKNHKFYLF